MALLAMHQGTHMDAVVSRRVCDFSSGTRIEKSIPISDNSSNQTSTVINSI